MMPCRDTSASPVWCQMVRESHCWSVVSHVIFWFCSSACVCVCVCDVHMSHNIVNTSEKVYNIFQLTLLLQDALWDRDKYALNFGVKVQGSRLLWNDMLATMLYGFLSVNICHTCWHRYVVVTQDFCESFCKTHSRTVVSCVVAGWRLITQLTSKKSVGISTTLG